MGGKHRPEVKAQTKFGSIISGTSTEEIFTACMAKLREMAWSRAKETQEIWDRAPEDCDLEHKEGVPCKACAEVRDGIVYAELWNAMSAEAPAYGYFGRNEDSLLGYWVDMRTIEDAIRGKKALQVNHLGLVPSGYSGDVFLVGENCGAGTLSYYKWANGRGYLQWSIK